MNDIITQCLASFAKPTPPVTAGAHASSQTANENEAASNANVNTGTGATTEKASSGHQAKQPDYAELRRNAEQININAEQIARNAEKYARQNAEHAARNAEHVARNAEHYARNGYHLFTNIASNFATMLDPFAQSFVCPPSNAGIPSTQRRCPFGANIPPFTTTTATATATSDAKTEKPASADDKNPISTTETEKSKSPEVEKEAVEKMVTDPIQIEDIEEDSDDEDLRVLRDLSEKVNSFEKISHVESSKNDTLSTGAIPKDASTSFTNKNNQEETKKASSPPACDWMLVDDDGHVVGESQPGISAEMVKDVQENEMDFHELSRLLSRHIISAKDQKDQEKKQEEPAVSNDEPKLQQAETSNASTSIAIENAKKAQTPPPTPASPSVAPAPSAPIRLHPGKL